jgi:hypothetical protein
MADNETYVTPVHIPEAFGAMPITNKKSPPRGDPGYTPIGSDSAAAKAAIAQRLQAKYAPAKSKR